MKDKKVSERSQYGFTKEKSCFTNLVASYNEATGLAGEGSVVDVIYLDFETAFHVGSKTIS